MAMGGHTVDIAMTRSDRQKDGLLLNTCKRTRRKQDRTGNLRLGLYEPWQQTLGAEDRRDEAKALPKQLVRRE
jgi:hypothetical protein